MNEAQNRKAREYLANQVMTAPKEHLLLMLCDGAVKFADRAKLKLADKDYEGFGHDVIRAQRILIELICSLKKELIGEEIYTNLVRLYNFVYMRFVEGNLKRDPVMIDEGLRIMKILRDTWYEAVERDRATRTGEPPSQAPRPGLSIQG